MAKVQSGNREKGKPDYINLPRDWQRAFGAGSLAPGAEVKAEILTGLQINKKNDFNNDERHLILRVIKQPDIVKIKPCYCAKCGFRWEENFCENCNVLLRSNY